MTPSAISATGHLPTGRDSATSRLVSVLRSLYRARCRQLLVDLAARALLAAIVLATLALLATRLAGVALAPLAIFGASLLLVVIAASVVAWRRWPDAMDVAVSADLTLELSQRLSTAFEFSRVGQRPHTVERLAQQVFDRGRLQERYRLLFPARAGTAAIVVPVALLALVLAATVDLPAAGPSVAADGAPQVREAGARLQAFGRDLQARARSGGLAESERAARHVQSLGGAMHDGRLDRAQALTRLRALSSELGEAQAALVDGGASSQLPGVGDTASRSATTASLTERLDAYSEGQPTTGLLLDDLERPGLEGAGITQADLRLSLAGREGSDDGAFGEDAPRLDEGDIAMRDARALDEARAALDRARRELGDPDATGSEPEAAANDDSDDFGDGPMDLPGESGGGRGEYGDSPGGTGAGSGSAEGSRAQQGRDAAEGGRALLRPQALPGGDGPLRRGAMRALPRLNDPPAITPQGNAQANAPPDASAEAALARESYPPRYKALVRRYFVSRASGEHAPDAATQPAGEPSSQP